MVEKATLSKKGQVTIPKSIREKLGLKAGKKVAFEIRGEEALVYHDYEEPLDELKRLRDEIQCDKEEIDEMIKRSKEKWSKLS